MVHTYPPWKHASPSSLWSRAVTYAKIDLLGTGLPPLLPVPRSDSDPFLFLIFAPQKTLYSLVHRKKLHGTTCFLDGGILVSLKWPTIGVFIDYLLVEIFEIQLPRSFPVCVPCVLKPDLSPYVLDLVTSGPSFSIMDASSYHPSLWTRIDGRGFLIFSN